MVGNLPRIVLVFEPRVPIDAAPVVLEVVVDLETDRHWPVVHQLQEHSVFAAGSVVTSNVVVVCAAVAQTVRLLLAVGIVGPVRITRLLYDSEIFGVFTGDEVRETPFAALCILGTADDVLRGKDRLESVVGEETNAGFQHSHRREGVTASARSLIANRRYVAVPSHLPPVKLLRKNAGL